MNATKHTPKRRRRKPGVHLGKIWPGGDGSQQFAQLLDRLSLAVLPIEEFVRRRGLSKSQRQRLRRSGEIWRRFVQLRDDPVTRPALIERMHNARMNDEEVATLLAAPTMREALGIVLLTAVRPSLNEPVAQPIQIMLGDPAVGLLDGLPPSVPAPAPQWGGPWNKTSWRRPSPLARVIAGVGLESLPPMPRDLASAIAGLVGER